MKLFEKLKQHFNPECYETGFASLDGLLEEKYSRFKYGIVIARKLDDDIIDLIEKGPTRDYFDCYHAINSELNETVNRIATFLNVNNVRAFPVKATVTDSELDNEFNKTLRFGFSHKMIATCAGIGWIGKTDLLVTFRFGPRVRLASVLVEDRISDPGTGIDRSFCGNCNLCVSKCPAGAASGRLWSIGLDRNEFYDPFKCRDYCRSISKTRIHQEISLCGICVSVCPKGRQSPAVKSR